MPIEQPDVMSEHGRGYVYEIKPDKHGPYATTSFWPYVEEAAGWRGYLPSENTRSNALFALRLYLGVPVEVSA